MVTSRLGEERITFSAVIAFSCSAVIRIQKNVTVFCYIKTDVIRLLIHLVKMGTILQREEQYTIMIHAA